MSVCGLELAVLMKLLWTVAEPLVRVLFDLLPEAPDPVFVYLPWPAWLPIEPFYLAGAMLFTVGSALLALRFARWIYGLVPVIQ